MKYYTDGFTFIKNPSDIGGGYTIVNENNILLKQETVSKVGFTNNEAELLGVYNGLLIAEEGSIISTDSKIIYWWILNIRKLLDKPNSKASRKRARKDLDEVKLGSNILATEKSISIIWEPRELNLAGIYNEEQEMESYLPDLSWIV